MICPKCQFEQPDGHTECVRCGIVFEKYKPVSEPEEPVITAEPAEDISLWTRLFTSPRGEGFRDSPFVSFLGTFLCVAAVIVALVSGRIELRGTVTRYAESPVGFLFLLLVLLGFGGFLFYRGLQRWREHDW